MKLGKDLTCPNCGQPLENIRWVIAGNRECCSKECRDNILNPVTADNDKPKDWDNDNN